MRPRPHRITASPSPADSARPPVAPRPSRSIDATRLTGVRRVATPRASRWSNGRFATDRPRAARAGLRACCEQGKGRRGAVADAVAVLRAAAGAAGRNRGTEHALATTARFTRDVNLGGAFGRSHLLGPLPARCRGSGGVAVAAATLRGRCTDAVDARPHEPPFAGRGHVHFSINVLRATAATRAERELHSRRSTNGCG